MRHALKLESVISHADTETVQEPVMGPELTDIKVL